MGEITNIAWCHHTFNPWFGCSKVSAGCKNCYAEVETLPRVQRARGIELWGEGAARHITGYDNWQKPRRWDRIAAAEGARRRVFCASMADIFEDRRDLDAPRERLFRLIGETRNLDWLLLTKRPQNIPRFVLGNRFPDHVWVGASVEDMDRARERIPHLLRVQAPVRFLSVEPMLEALDLREMELIPGTFCDPLRVDDHMADGASFGRINWVICGGESGPRARPFDLAWGRTLRDQCRKAGTAFFMKQLGADAVQNSADAARFGSLGSLRDSHGGDPGEWPRDMRVRQLPRGAS